MQESQPDKLIVINTFDEYYDLEGNVTAYHVTFLDETGEEAGYALLSLLTGDSEPIVEFSFTGSGYNEVLAQQTSTSSTLRTTTNVVYTGPGCMYTQQSDGKLLSAYTGTTFTPAEIEESYSTYLTLIRDNSDGDYSTYAFDRGGIYSWNDAALTSECTHRVLPSFGSGSDYFTQGNLGSGNICAPTTATNIIWYFASKLGCWPACAPLSSATSHTKAAYGALIFSTVKNRYDDNLKRNC